MPLSTEIDETLAEELDRPVPTPEEARKLAEELRAYWNKMPSERELLAEILQRLHEKVDAIDARLDAEL